MSKQAIVIGSGIARKNNIDMIRLEQHLLLKGIGVYESLYLVD